MFHIAYNKYIKNLKKKIVFPNSDYQWIVFYISFEYLLIVLVYKGETKLNAKHVLCAQLHIQYLLQLWSTGFFF